jgi:outer membrane lipoprotein carrier protein
MTKLLTALGLLLASPGVFASPAADLQRYLDEIQTLRADFVQSNRNTGGPRERVSQGRLALQTPGKFRWDYEQPYQQLIIADGDRVWHYDPDLEQVTVQPLASAMGSTPLGLLMGEAPVDQGFKVSDLGANGDQRWFELRPLADDSHFNIIRIALEKGTLSALELDDALGQTTRLRFENVADNVEIDPELFRFVPPAGVDVIGDG